MHQRDLIALFCLLFQKLPNVIGFIRVQVRRISAGRPPTAHWQTHTHVVTRIAVDQTWAAHVDMHHRRCWMALVRDRRRRTRAETRCIRYSVNSTRCHARRIGQHRVAIALTLAISTIHFDHALELILIMITVSRMALKILFCFFHLQFFWQ